MQNFDSARRGTLAQTGNHGVQKAAKSREQKRTSEGDGHALMLEIGFTHRLGVGKKKPREHGQDPACCRKQYIAFSIEFGPINHCKTLNLCENIP